MRYLLILVLLFAGCSAQAPVAPESQPPPVDPRVEELAKLQLFVDTARPGWKVIGTNDAAGYSDDYKYLLLTKDGKEKVILVGKLEFELLGDKTQEVMFEAPYPPFVPDEPEPEPADYEPAV